MLEVFGGKGEYHTLHYCNKVKSLDIWEINKEFQTDLRKICLKQMLKLLIPLKRFQE